MADFSSFPRQLAHLSRRVIHAWQRQPIMCSLLALFFLAGSYLRFHDLSATMMFQGDQGRDALVVSRIFRAGDLAFIGPVTSVGNMYLGPFYYYYMLPWLWLTYPSPIGPVIGVALANCVTIVLLFFCGRRLVGSRAALWASGFFAFSRIALTHSRFSWNPNLTALFTLLTLYFLVKACRDHSRYWPWVALSAGLLIQLHYVNLIIVAVCGIFWLLSLYRQRRQSSPATAHFWRHSFLALAIFALTTLPLLLFDAKHDWLNLQAAASIFTQESSFSSQITTATGATGGVLTSLREIPGRLGHLFSTLPLPRFDIYSFRLALGIGTLVIWLIFTFARRRHRFALTYQVLTVTVLVSALALAFYRHSVFDHYLLFFLPVVFLIYGSLLAALRRYRFFYPVIILLVFSFYLYSNYQPHFYQGDNQRYQNFATVVRTLLASIPTTSTYNFVLLNDQHDALGDHYRYFFDAYSDNLVSMDQSHDADYLFVIDETRQADLYDNPSYELVVFRNLPQATVSAVPSPDDGPLLYRFSRPN
jgi:4-amino-4-deoxy-L-arabinose transferase-like glycosyltransferase